MSITIGGLASGIDTASIVQSLVTAANKPKEVMQEQETALESRKSAYATLSSRLTSLKTSLEAMDTVNEFRSVAATSGDADVVDATVTGSAVVGSFSVQVNQLAAASLDVSDAYASRTDTGVLATGTLGITVGGTTTNVTIDSTNSSLDDIAAAINDQVSGVTAYVMDTGDATTPYRLVVAGESTGTANAVSLDTSGLDPATGAVPAFTAATTASDANVTVNGVSITDSDNDIDGAIQGVTFHAHSVSTSAVNVSVARDTDTMVTTVKAFVTAWNAVLSQVSSQQVWNPDENLKGSFVGESEPTTVVQRLQSLCSASYTSGTDITSLSQIGITTSESGDLEVDDTTLNAALSGNFDEVVALFTDSDKGVNAALQTAIDGFTDSDDGTVTARVDTLSDQIDTMTTRIDDFQKRTDAYEERLKKQFTAMEVTMGRLQTAQSSLLALLPSTSSSSS